jgi:hypothetical protein
VIVLGAHTLYIIYYMMAKGDRYEENAAMNLQEDASKRLIKASEVIYQTAEIGTASSHVLRAQGDQLQNAHGRLDSTEKNIQDARHSTKELLKSLAFDSVLMALFILVLAAGGVLIFLLINVERT